MIILKALFTYCVVLRFCKYTKKLTMKEIAVYITIIIGAVMFIIYKIGKLEMATNLKPLNTQKKYNLIGTPLRHVPLDEIYKNDYEYDDFYNDISRKKPVFMIDTPGCRIPIAILNYNKTKMSNASKNFCGVRKVYVKKIGSSEVVITVNAKFLLELTKNGGHCCYRFKDAVIYHNKSYEKFSSCVRLDNIKLQNGERVGLQSDFLDIQCVLNNNTDDTHTIYDDRYVFSKKILKTKMSSNIEYKNKYNVLMIGMDTMSLSRFAQTMPRTIKHFENNYYLGFRGYHKVGDNTLPNLMAVLTGQNSTILEKCKNKMDECHDMLLFDEFKKAGYATAYGEDYLRLPDTFSKKYNFKIPPTDHYLRPFFYNAEREIHKYVCTGQISSAKQILDFAIDFALTYRKENFFGLFWINSFSHNEHSNPHNADKLFENFFNQIRYTGILDNTFVIFFSDHGIRFGKLRMQIASYYDERLPSLFILPPLRFKNGKKFKNIIINQHRLVTPYDLYDTLKEIKQMGLNESMTVCSSNGQSLFKEISSNRTCQDAAIHDKWCSCHKLYMLDNADPEGMKSVILASSYIKKLSKSIQTKPCYTCMKISLKKVLRIHFYYDQPTNTKLYHVVAFTMTPGNVSYEATVSKENDKSKLIGTVSVISPYRGLGKCTDHNNDRLFCVCSKKC